MIELNLKAIGEQVRPVVRNSLPMTIYSRCASTFDAFHGARQFGLNDYRKLSAVRRRSLTEAPAAVSLRPLPHPFYVRPGTGDANLVLHAIAREAYSYRLPARPVHFVVDAGANIGDTTGWYATKFPEALVAATEPNPDNFEILSRNCALFGNRIRLFNAGLWPVADRSLAVLGANEGPWVQESSDTNDLTCRTLDPLSILRDAGFETIDIFKIDIEGAELPLFLGDCDTWLRRTRSIAIEIHTDEAREVVLSATRRNGFRFTIYRDLHLFWR